MYTYTQHTRIYMLYNDTFQHAHAMQGQFYIVSRTDKADVCDTTAAQPCRIYGKAGWPSFEVIQICTFCVSMRVCIYAWMYDAYEYIHTHIHTLYTRILIPAVLINLAVANICEY